ncbi:hypothetical protein N7917_05810 [Bacillus sp. OR9]|nr:hypothetical protein [Bacillus sp. OR9]
MDLELETFCNEMKSKFSVAVRQNTVGVENKLLVKSKFINKIEGTVSKLNDYRSAV